MNARRENRKGRTQKEKLTTEDKAKWNKLVREIHKLAKSKWGEGPFNEIGACFGISGLSKMRARKTKRAQAEILKAMKEKTDCTIFENKFSGDDTGLKTAGYDSLMEAVQLIPTCHNNEKNIEKLQRCRVLEGGKKPFKGSFSGSKKVAYVIKRMSFLKRIFKDPTLCEEIKKCVAERLIMGKRYDKFALNSSERKKKKARDADKSNAAENKRKKKKQQNFDKMKQKFNEALEKYKQALKDVENVYCAAYKRYISINSNTVVKSKFSCVSQKKTERFLGKLEIEQKKCEGFQSTLKEPDYESQNGDNQTIIDVCNYENWAKVKEEHGQGDHFQNVKRKFHFYGCNGEKCNTPANVNTTCDPIDNDDFKTFYKNHVHDCLLETDFKIKKFFCTKKGKKIKKIADCKSKEKKNGCRRKRGFTCSKEIVTAIKELVSCVDTSMGNSTSPYRNKLDLLVNTIFKKYCSVNINGKLISVQAAAAELKFILSRSINTLTVTDLKKLVNAILEKFEIDPENVPKIFEKVLNVLDDENDKDDSNKNTGTGGNTGSNATPIRRRRLNTDENKFKTAFMGGTCLNGMTGESVTVNGVTLKTLDCSEFDMSFNPDTFSLNEDQSAKQLIGAYKTTANSNIRANPILSIFLIFIILFF